MRFRVLILCMLSIAVAEEKCKTPNNEEAECVSLFMCPILTRALASQQDNVIEFVQKSNCGGTALNPLVCCGSVSSFTTPSSETEKVVVRHSNKDKLLPDRSYCGYQHTDDYFHSSNDTSIDEFPWLANLRYRTRLGLTTKCGGTLINNRYILTAAQCVTQDKLVLVRLGEFNVKNETDCVGEYTSELYECSDPPQDFGIEKTIVHAEYQQGSSIENDIALVRLDKPVLYTDYVRPICLPTLKSRLAKPGDTLTTTGWGKNVNVTVTETKKKVLQKYISKEECIAAIQQYEKYVRDNQFCSRSLESNTDITCRGDSGSPIMYSYRNQWQVEGIAIFGAGDCLARYPDVNTKVANYLDWIKEAIEP